MNFTFSKSKKNLLIIIILLIFLSISLPHGLRGYPLSILFLFWAYINKSKKTSLFAGGTSKDKIKNWERLIKFENTFFTFMGIVILIAQTIINCNIKNSEIVVVSILFLFGVILPKFILRIIQQA